MEPVKQRNRPAEVKIIDLEATIDKWYPLHKHNIIKAGFNPFKPDEYFLTRYFGDTHSVSYMRHKRAAEIMTQKMLEEGLVEREAFTS